MSTQKTEYCHVGYRKPKQNRAISLELAPAFEDQIKAAYRTCASELMESGVHLSYKDFLRNIMRLGLEAHTGSGGGK